MEVTLIPYLAHLDVRHLDSLFSHLLTLKATYAKNQLYDKKSNQKD
jgi:hypothetical protein